MSPLQYKTQEMKVPDAHRTCEPLYSSGGERILVEATSKILPELCVALRVEDVGLGTECCPCVVTQSYCG
jgi:hypothetical protein